MKRRSFIQKVSSASSVFMMTPGGMINKSGRENIKNYIYPEPKNLDDILTKDNQVMLRFELRAQSSALPVSARFKFEISKGKLDRKKHYFFEDDQNVTYDKAGFARFQVNQAYPRIIVAWIDQPSENTEVKLFLNGAKKAFTLKELIEEAQIDFAANEIQVGTNYLLDHEIAFATPQQLGIKEPQGAFSIAVLADTQGGDPATTNNLSTRIKIHNAFNVDTVQIVNKLDPQPAFSLVLGDVVDNQGEKQHFEVMHEYLKEIKSPVLYAVGNHETRYSAQFSPGYKMEELNNYFDAQKAINGTEWILYSFNL
ncbi:metallophosphoesterase, partial [Aquiflexum sp.]|uniref:metallophosphoesterase n=1 Tax=Aquiflexum sp. TaxID=1872584 RepID=UPI0035940DBF